MSKVFQSLRKCDIQYLPSLYHLNVRWGTKPRWLPTAPSKLFRVKQRPVVPIEETIELKALYYRYKTQMKSIKIFFNEVHRANETSEEVLQRLEQEKEDDWRKCMELNDKWNAEVAAERVKRDAEAMAKELEEIREEVRIKEQEEKERLEKLEEIIRQEKEASKHFITENNIDEVIAEILNSPPHTFNFAIDTQGRKYSGLSSTPDIETSEQKSDENEVEEFNS